ncbi:ParB/RepB/Spo0J family partition protein [Larkinella soli]|uniref:ParB/RepB/Spo0J family partition protein n=1 Tax=Larkinella soli TaxID=1770527 RepID=UPI000FFC4A14|nr:DNA methyltransferase [Larkinella soli]
MTTQLLDIALLDTNDGQIEGLPKNPRFIKDERFHKLVQSIRDDPEMLDLRECIVYPYDDRFVVIAGNMRLRAMKELKYKTVPCKVLPADTAAEKLRAYTIKDNVPYGEHDTDLLANEWDVAELAAWGLEMDWPVEAAEAEEDNYTGEPPADPVTVLGDLYELNGHRVLCGDSTDSDAVVRLMDGEVPDLVHTDPPYGMNAVSKSGVLKDTYGRDILGDDNPDVAKDAFRLIYSLYPDAKQVWWGANYYSSVLPDSECWLVWDKDNGQSDQTDCELAWANFRSVVRQFTKASEKTNRIHPTQKPVGLVAWIFDRFDSNFRLVADYFGGSGVTLMAAEQYHRPAYLMEYDPRFVDVIVKRWVAYMAQNNRPYTVKRNGEDITKADWLTA